MVFAVKRKNLGAMPTALRGHAFLRISRRIMPIQSDGHGTNWIVIEIEHLPRKPKVGQLFIERCLAELRQLPTMLKPAGRMSPLLDEVGQFCDIGKSINKKQKPSQRLSTTLFLFCISHFNFFNGQAPSCGPKGWRGSIWLGRIPPLAFPNPADNVSPHAPPTGFDPPLVEMNTP